MLELQKIKRIDYIMKKILKKISVFFLCAALLSAPFSIISCSKQENDGQLTVLCTVFPLYDWVKNIVGDSDNVEALLLVNNGTDLHSYQPSFEDMAKIKDSDVVVYIGGESDKWVEDSISDTASRIKLSALDGISLCSISDESIAEAHGEEHAHSHDESFDEHLWLSLGNAVTACKHISDTLCSLDAKNAESYVENTADYISRVDELDQSFTEICANAPSHVIFADRFPFVYLFEEYGVGYYAAFEGCTTDTNADFDTVIKLASRLNELNVGYVLVTENPTKGLAEKVIAESNAKNAQIVSLNSMQAVTADENTDYVEIMRANAEALKKIFTSED